MLKTKETTRWHSLWRHFQNFQLALSSLGQPFARATIQPLCALTPRHQPRSSSSSRGSPLARANTPLEVRFVVLQRSKEIRFLLYADKVTQTSSTMRLQQEETFKCWSLELNKYFRLTYNVEVIRFRTISHEAFSLYNTSLDLLWIYAENCFKLWLGNLSSIEIQILEILQISQIWKWNQKINQKQNLCTDLLIYPLSVSHFALWL